MCDETAVVAVDKEPRAPAAEVHRRRRREKDGEVATVVRPSHAGLSKAAATGPVLAAPVALRHAARLLEQVAQAVEADSSELENLRSQITALDQELEDSLAAAKRREATLNNLLAAEKEARAAAEVELQELKVSISEGLPCSASKKADDADNAGDLLAKLAAKTLALGTLVKKQKQVIVHQQAHLKALGASGAELPSEPRKKRRLSCGPASPKLEGEVQVQQSQSVLELAMVAVEADCQEDPKVLEPLQQKPPVPAAQVPTAQTVRARAVDLVAAAKGQKGVIPCRCVVRKQSMRNKLQGFDCELCRGFYNATGQRAATAPMKSSRHRFEHPPVSTPPGFWDLSFPQ